MLKESLLELYGMYIDEFSRKYEIICTSFNSFELSYVAQFNGVYYIFIDEIIYDIENKLDCTIKWYDDNNNHKTFLPLYEYAKIGIKRENLN